MKHTALMASVVLLLSFPPLATAQSPLRWAADAEGGAPFIFKEPRNVSRNIGFEVDLKRALERELGRKIEFVQYEYVKLTEGLERGDFDFIMNGFDITADRVKRVRFTRPYYAYRLELAVRADDHRFDTLAALKQAGGVVGTLEDTAASRYLKRQRVRTKEYTDQTGPYNDLAAGVIDGVLMDAPIAEYYGKKSLVTEDTALFQKATPPFRFIDHFPTYYFYAIAVQKDNVALAAELNAALDRLLADGTLQRIYEKWGLWDSKQEKLLAEYRGDTAGEDTVGGGVAELLLKGAGMTVFLTFTGFALAVVLGLPIALLRLYGPAPLRSLALLYVEFFRGIPVLLLLVFLYFGLPEMARAYRWVEHGVTLKLDPVVAAILGFGLNYAAYESEIYRAGLGAIPIGQWEAARSLGMSDALTFRRIILPQSIRIILPPMTNDLVALFKDTSVVSVIAVVELSKQYQILTRSNAGDLVTIALATAALYLVMSVPLGLLSRHLERRWAVRS